MKNKQTIGEMIREIRIKSGYLQWEFGAKLGVTQPYISMIEKYRKPSREFIKKMSQVFNVNCDHIYKALDEEKVFLKKIKSLDVDKRRKVREFIDSQVLR